MVARCRSRPRGCLPTPIESAVPEDAAPVLELSVVMPCLNEADTLAACIQKAWRAMGDHGIVGEVIVADNGSTDGSPEIAAALGARVVHVGRTGVRQRTHGWDRCLRRAVRGDRRRGRFLRLRRAAEVRREAARRVRPRAGLPARARWGTRHARRDAQVAPLVGQPDVHRDGALVVPRPGQRRVLRDARLHQGALRKPVAAMQRHGVRHRDDHPLEPRQRAVSPRSRSPSIRTGARRTHLTCTRSATGGARCASSCSTALAGSS